jgi:plasmid maintenance system antidote protein VapI
MTNTGKLQGKMREVGVSIEKLAEAVGLSRTGLFNKIHGKQEFLASEVYKVSKALGITNDEMRSIFFADGVE